MRLTAANGFFYADGAPMFIRSGEMHYFRIHPDVWPASLAKLKDAGLNTISTYIPWIWHEYEDNSFDFTGETHPQRNLVGFVESVKEAGLFLMIRPGPFIYAEYQGLGIPLWLGEHYPDTVVRHADGSLDRGRFYFNHSLMSPTYLHHVTKWYQRVGQVIKQYCYHPIIAIQIDNETGTMYANALGRIDFNKDTVSRYRQFLRDKYKTIQQLNSVWETEQHDFDAVFPPRRPFRQGEAVDWQTFLEHWVADYLSFLGSLVADIGLGLPVCINDSATFISPANPKLKTPFANLQGYDTYIKFTGTKRAADLPFASSQDPEFFHPFAAENKPLFALESQCGWFDQRAFVPVESTVQSMLAGLAHGVKGINLYNVQHGTDPNGSSYNFQTLLDREGNILPRYAVVQRIEKLIADLEAELLFSEEIYDPIGYVSYYPSRRFLPSSYMLRQSIINPARFLAQLGQEGLYALMLTAGYSPRVIDVQELGGNELDHFKLIVFPSNGYIDESSYAKFLAFVEKGGNLITTPMVPTRNLYGRPLQGQGLYPLEPAGERWLDSGRLMFQMLVNWFLRYRLFVRPQIARRAETTLNIVDNIEPITVGLSTNWRGARLSTESGTQVRGDFYMSFFQGAARPLLKFGNRTVGYSSDVGKGTSTVIGTCLAGRYVTPRYYNLPAGERRDLRDFISALVSGFGVTKRFETDLEVEIIERQSKAARLLFIINRTERQIGRIHLAVASSPNLRQGGPTLDTLCCFKNSTAKLVGGDIEIAIDTDDVLVLRLTR